MSPARLLIAILVCLCAAVPSISGCSSIERGSADTHAKLTALFEGTAEGVVGKPSSAGSDTRRMPN